MLTSVQVCVHNINPHRPTHVLGTYVRMLSGNRIQERLKTQSGEESSSSEELSLPDWDFLETLQSAISIQ